MIEEHPRSLLNHITVFQLILSGIIPRWQFQNQPGHLAGKWNKLTKDLRNLLQSSNTHDKKHLDVTDSGVTGDAFATRFFISNPDDA